VQQLQIVFAAANSMTKYVVEHYPRREKSEGEGEA
jgi:hypothetical protein